VLTPELRCLNRGSIVLVTISIVFLAIIIENINHKLYLKIAEIALSILLIFTIYAEVDYKPDYWTEESEQLAKEYSDFFNQIEMSVNEDDMIYQLPMTQFPESIPVYKMDDYSHFIAYLYTDKLKWSYGGMKGRNTIATGLFIDNGMSDTFFQGIKSAGYSGIYIDGYGYEDNGVEIVLFYTNLLNQKPLISSDGRLYFFKI